MLSDQHNYLLLVECVPPGQLEAPTFVFLLVCWRGVAGTYFRVQRLGPVRLTKGDFPHLFVQNHTPDHEVAHLFHLRNLGFVVLRDGRRSVILSHVQNRAILTGPLPHPLVVALDQCVVAELVLAQALVQVTKYPIHPRVLVAGARN